MRKLKQNIGAALIEFAILFMVLFFLIVGIMEFSVIFYDKLIITNASREGARYGIVYRTPSYPTSAQVITEAKNYCSKYLFSLGGTNAVTVTAVSSSSPPVTGATLTVTVSYVYTDLMLHIFIGHGKGYSLTSTTVMTYE